MPDLSMSGLTMTDLFLAVPLAAIAVLLILGPVRDGKWKARIASEDDPKARLKFYRETMLWLWGVAALCVAGWMLSGRTLPALGFDGTLAGWRGGLVWGAAGAALVYMIWTAIETARSRKSRNSVRRQVGAMGGLDLIRARTPAEHDRFLAVAVTAGITEEIIFRGFLIGALALVLPVWAAATLSVLGFTLGHLYQGPNGLARVLPVAILLTLIFLIGGSLWPVILVHAAVDLTGGIAFRMVDRFADADATAENPASPA